jgi:hypothetical protein
MEFVLGSSCQDVMPTTCASRVMTLPVSATSKLTGLANGLRSKARRPTLLEPTSRLLLTVHIALLVLVRIFKPSNRAH